MKHFKWNKHKNRIGKPTVVGKPFRVYDGIQVDCHSKTQVGILLTACDYFLAVFWPANGCFACFWLLKIFFLAFQHLFLSHKVKKYILVSARCWLGGRGRGLFTWACDVINGGLLHRIWKSKILKYYNVYERSSFPKACNIFMLW